MKIYRRTLWCCWIELQNTLDKHQDWNVINIIERTGDYCAFYYIVKDDDINVSEETVVDTNKKKI